MFNSHVLQGCALSLVDSLPRPIVLYLSFFSPFKERRVYEQRMKFVNPLTL